MRAKTASQYEAAWKRLRQARTIFAIWGALIGTVLLLKWDTPFDKDWLDAALFFAIVNAAIVALLLTFFKCPRCQSRLARGIGHLVGTRECARCGLKPYEVPIEATGGAFLPSSSQ